MHLGCSDFQWHWSKLVLEGTPSISSKFAWDQLCENERMFHSIAEMLSSMYNNSISPIQTYNSNIPLGLKSVVGREQTIY